MVPKGDKIKKPYSIISFHNSTLHVSCKPAKLKLIVLTKLFFLEKIKDMLLSTLEHNLADT